MPPGTGLGDSLARRSMVEAGRVSFLWDFYRPNGGLAALETQWRIRFPFWPLIMKLRGVVCEKLELDQPDFRLVYRARTGIAGVLHTSWRGSDCMKSHITQGLSLHFSLSTDVCTT